MKTVFIIGSSTEQDSSVLQRSFDILQKQFTFCDLDGMQKELYDRKNTRFAF